MNYKYTLIISQYYHSRHMFIVKIPSMETMKKVIEELEDYKRKEKYEYQYGDVGFLENREERFYRYNINDEGDIYFINSISIENLMETIKEYSLKTYRESRRYIRKEVLHDISIHHDYDMIRKIIEKYCKLV